MIRPMLSAANHSAPSDPATMLVGRNKYGKKGMMGYPVNPPDVVIRPIPIVLEVCSVNHSAPSGPATMPVGPLPEGPGYSVTTPDVVMRPIDPAMLSVNHSAPSGPAAISSGSRTGKVVTAPDVVMRPICPKGLQGVVPLPMQSCTVNHKAPSGPAVIAMGAAGEGSGIEYSVMLCAPALADQPTRIVIASVKPHTSADQPLKSIAICPPKMRGASSWPVPPPSAYCVSTATLVEPRTVPDASLNATKMRLVCGTIGTLPPAVAQMANVGVALTLIVVVTVEPIDEMHWIPPSVVMRPIVLRLSSVNHIAPSDPNDIARGVLPLLVANSVITPLVVIRPKSFQLLPRRTIMRRPGRPQYCQPPRYKL